MNDFEHSNKSIFSSILALFHSKNRVLDMPERTHDSASVYVKSCTTFTASGKCPSGSRTTRVSSKVFKIPGLAFQICNGG